ncbi:MAG TPA: hypothetical protein VD965_11975 [Burkholderiales bacterium]|nr:hypothetical protein [Burkholderiales bacterium]
MKAILYALPFFALAAFAQDPPSKLTQGADKPPQDAASKSRQRTEGSAGGTGQPVTKEMQDGAEAGAGPHLRDKRLKNRPGRVHREGSSERESSRGSTDRQ